MRFALGINMMSQSDFLVKVKCQSKRGRQMERQTDTVKQTIHSLTSLGGTM